MEATTISATDLRTQARDIIERARFKSERFVIQTFGKPVAVIIGIDDYLRLLESAKDTQSHSKDKASPQVLQIEPAQETG
jgi:prevent-host-death family protein